MKPDPIAAAISLVVLMLSAVGLPSWLKLGPDATTAIGGGIVAIAAIARALVRRHRKSPLDWRDVTGTVVGVLSSALGITDLVAGTGVLEGIDAETIAMVGSGLAAAFAAHRADLIMKPPAPPTNGLLLLVLASCASRPDWNGTCTEYAVSVVQKQWGVEGSADAIFVTEALCRREIAEGRDVCIDRRALGGGCIRGVRGVTAGR